MMRVCDRCKKDKNIDIIYIPCKKENAKFEFRWQPFKEAELCKNCREELYSLINNFLEDKKEGEKSERI